MPHLTLKKAIAKRLPGFYAAFPPAFFVFALGLFAAGMFHMTKSIYQARKVRAVPAVKLTSFDRTPSFEIGGRRFAVLGLKESGGGKRPPSVWVRDQDTGLIRTFRPGDNLFKGPVILSHAGTRHVDFLYRGKTRRILLRP